MENVSILNFLLVFVGVLVVVLMFFKNVMTEDESTGLSSGQVAIIRGIDLLMARYGSLNAGWEGTVLLKKLEYLVPKFDAGRTNSNVLKVRLEKVYRKLNAAVSESEYFGDLAFEFANKYNLFPKSDKVPKLAFAF